MLRSTMINIISPTTCYLIYTLYSKSINCLKPDEHLSWAQHTDYYQRKLHEM